MSKRIGEEENWGRWNHEGKIRVLRREEVYYMSIAAGKSGIIRSDAAAGPTVTLGCITAEK